MIFYFKPVERSIVFIVAMTTTEGCCMHMAEIYRPLNSTQFQAKSQGLTGKTENLTVIFTY